MEQVKNLIGLISERLKAIAGGNAVVAKPVSLGDRHVVPLCELSIAFAGAGATAEGKDGGGQLGGGQGQGAGGGAKASPIAVLVIEGEKVRLEKIGR
ncbi:MAG: spore germination protein GerW family protein [Myxococcales bacterium]|nr:spore germination protein GerW family protein [Myxococcales bacterium]